MGASELSSNNQDWNVAIGMLLTVLGAVLASLGTVLSRKVLIRVSTQQKQIVTYAINSKEWWTAQFTYVTGNLIHFIALKFAPASILAPLNASGLAANAIFCRVILHETLTLMTSMATGGVICGVIICAISAQYHVDPEGISPDIEALESWYRMDFVLFFALSVLISLVGFGILQAIESYIDKKRWNDLFVKHLERRHIEDEHLVSYPLVQQNESSQSMGHSSGKTYLNIESPVKDYPSVESISYPTAIGISYGMIAGLVGSFTVLELKECISLSMQEKPHSSPQFWLSVVLTILSIFFQNHLLNMGLVRNDAVVVIPCYYVVWISASTLGGYLKFHEFDVESTEALLLIVALLVTIISLIPLAVDATLQRHHDANNVLEHEAIATFHRERLKKNYVTLPMGYTVVTVGGISRVDKSPIQIGSDLGQIRHAHTLQPLEISVGINDRADECMGLLSNTPRYNTTHGMTL